MKKKNSKKNHFARWIKATILAGGLILFLRFFILIPINVSGDSMNPTLPADSYIVYEPYTTIDRFDIVLFYDNQGQAYIKRVIGLPGETLAYHDDQLYINNKPVNEGYLENQRMKNQLLTPDFNLERITGEQEIPEGSYFVLGDNRPRSKDSRMFGFVPRNAIKGKARMVIYPFDELAIFP